MNVSLMEGSLDWHSDVVSEYQCGVVLVSVLLFPLCGFLLAVPFRQPRPVSSFLSFAVLKAPLIPSYLFTDKKMKFAIVTLVA